LQLYISTVWYTEETAVISGFTVIESGETPKIQAIIDTASDTSDVTIIATIFSFF